MLNSSCINRVYLAIGATDLRKSIDGLAILVAESFKPDPFSRNLFVFCNRKQDKIKILDSRMGCKWILATLQKIRKRYFQMA